MTGTRSWVDELKAQLDHVLSNKVSSRKTVAAYEEWKKVRRETFEPKVEKKQPPQTAYYDQATYDAFFAEVQVNFDINLKQYGKKKPWKIELFKVIGQLCRMAASLEYVKESEQHTRDLISEEEIRLNNIESAKKPDLVEFERLKSEFKTNCESKLETEIAACAQAYFDKQVKTHDDKFQEFKTNVVALTKALREESDVRKLQARKDKLQKEIGEAKALFLKEKEELKKLNETKENKKILSDFQSPDVKESKIFKTYEEDYSTLKHHFNELNSFLTGLQKELDKDKVISSLTSGNDPDHEYKKLKKIQDSNDPKIEQDFPDVKTVKSVIVKQYWRFTMQWHKSWDTFAKFAETLFHEWNTKTTVNEFKVPSLEFKFLHFQIQEMSKKPQNEINIKELQNLFLQLSAEARGIFNKCRECLESFSSKSLTAKISLIIAIRAILADVQATVEDARLQVARCCKAELDQEEKDFTTQYQTFCSRVNQALIQKYGDLYKNGKAARKQREKEYDGLLRELDALVIPEYVEAPVPPKQKSPSPTASSAPSSPSATQTRKRDAADSQSTSGTTKHVMTRLDADKIIIERLKIFFIDGTKVTKPKKENEKWEIKLKNGEILMVDEKGRFFYNFFDAKTNKSCLTRLKQAPQAAFSELVPENIRYKPT